MTDRNFIHLSEGDAIRLIAYLARQLTDKPDALEHALGSSGCISVYPEDGPETIISVTKKSMKAVSDIGRSRFAGLTGNPYGIET